MTVDRGDGQQVAAILRASALVQDALNGCLDVFGGQIGAIVELDALANVEHIGRWIWYFPALGEQRLDDQVLVEPGQSLIQEVGDAEIGQRWDIVWIEPADSVVRASMKTSDCCAATEAGPVNSPGACAMPGCAQSGTAAVKPARDATNRRRFMANGRSLAMAFPPTGITTALGRTRHGDHLRAD